MLSLGDVFSSSDSLQSDRVVMSLQQDPAKKDSVNALSVTGHKH